MSKKIISLLTSAAIGLAAAGPLQADLFANSYLSIQNLQFLDDTGAILDADIDFIGTIDFTSSADMDGALTGTAGYTFPSPNAGDIDFPSQCLSTTGDCPVLVENQQPPTLLTGPQGTDFVTSDQYQVGAPIANLANLLDDPSGNTDFTTGADILQIATANLSATAAEGTANVNNGLEANWTFSLAGAGVITIAADDLSAYIEAFAGAGELFPGKASASTEFILTITDIDGGSGGGIIFGVNLFGFGGTTSANATGSLNDLQLCGGFVCGVGVSGAFSTSTGPLVANNEYQLSIRSNANIDIARVAVPEPGMLALLGMGLMGMFLSRRRA